MDLKQLLAVQAIAETGSFRAAAQRLNLTQPAISYQLKRLEEELGETLVFRHAKRVELAPAGHTVLETAKRVLNDIEELKDRFGHDDEDRLRGVLRITTSAMGIVYFYGDLLERFIARYPNIEVVLTAAETPLGAIQQVLAQAADVALTPFAFDLPNLHTLELGEAAYIVIVAPSHPLARRNKVDIKDLHEYPFVRYQPGAGGRIVSDRLFSGPEGYPRILLESNDSEFVKRIVALGMAASTLPRPAAAKEVEDGTLSALRIVDDRLKQRFGLVFRGDVRMRVLDLFRDFAAQNRSLVPS